MFGGGTQFKPYHNIKLIISFLRMERLFLVGGRVATERNYINYKINLTPSLKFFPTFFLTFWGDPSPISVPLKKTETTCLQHSSLILLRVFG